MRRVNFRSEARKRPEVIAALMALMIITNFGVVFAQEARTSQTGQSEQLGQATTSEPAGLTGQNAQTPTALPLVYSQTKSDAKTYRLVFESAAIASGTLKDLSRRTLVVQVPPSYDASLQKRYPVVYSFHGFGNPATELISALNSQATSTSASASSAKPLEYIIVAIDGSNKKGGSFYVNSTITGNYEDMVLSEVIPLVDANFRTLATREARIVAGFSMGGFAAWNLALAHPDVFAAAWACAPGAFDANGLRDAIRTWDSGFRDAYGSAFAPLVAQPSKAPVFNNSPADLALIALWEAGFGGVKAKLERYRSLGIALKEIRFDYGTRDYYAWIPRGTIALEAELRAAGIPSSIAAHNTGHQITPGMLTDGLLPLIQRVFGELKNND